MTHEVEALLDTFDHLPEAQQQEAASEILRRVQRLTFDPMSDDELVRSAEGLFLELDRREEANDRS
jgi:hypothetical protein